MIKFYGFVQNVKKILILLHHNQKLLKRNLKIIILIFDNDVFNYENPTENNLNNNINNENNFVQSVFKKVNSNCLNDKIYRIIIENSNSNKNIISNSNFNNYQRSHIFFSLLNLDFYYMFLHIILKIFKFFFLTFLVYHIFFFLHHLNIYLKNLNLILYFYKLL